MLDAVRHLALAIQCQQRYEISVVGLEDRDTQRDRHLWGKIETSAMKVRGPRAFGYAPVLLKTLQSQNPDLLHVHGLWMYTSVAAARWSRPTKPYLVSPHGMLDPWALNNSRWKKRISAMLYENEHLRGAACVHALNDAEAQAIRAYGLTNPICIVPNGVQLPEETEVSYPKKHRYLLYLGRLHPKKGLASLIEAWSRIQKDALAAGWKLTIAGWDQNNHRSELEALTEKLRATGTISFVGPQFGSAKAGCFNDASAFVLPSLSEGLPMSVLEAWSWRLPAVITPSCNLAEGARVGAAIMTDADVESMSKALLQLFAMSPAELEAMGSKGRRLVEEHFQWPWIARQLAQVYDWILGSGPRPACVLN